MLCSFLRGRWVGIGPHGSPVANKQSIINISWPYCNGKRFFGPPGGLPGHAGDFAPRCPAMKIGSGRPVLRLPHDYTGLFLSVKRGQVLSSGTSHPGGDRGSRKGGPGRLQGPLEEVMYLTMEGVVCRAGLGPWPRQPPVTGSPVATVPGYPGSFSSMCRAGCILVTRGGEGARARGLIRRIRCSPPPDKDLLSSKNYGDAG